MQNSHFGHWSRDAAGLPCFELTASVDQHPYTPLKHLMATGRLSAFADRWGNLSLFTTEGAQGFQDITINQHQCRSGLYAMLRIGEETISLIFSEMPEARKVVYGCGYAVYSAELRRDDVQVRLEQKFLAMPDARRGILCWFTLTNLAETPLEAEWQLCADLTAADTYHKLQLLDPRTGPGSALLPVENVALRNLFVAGPADWSGAGISLVAIGVTKSLHIAAGETAQAVGAVGYGCEDDLAAAREAIDSLAWEDALQAQADRMESVRLDPPEDWMRDEALWTMNQLLAFKNYDSTLGEFYISLGGYGWRGFNQRELGEDALVLSPWYPEEAAGCLRWMARSQYANGDLPPGFGLSEKSVPRTPPGAVLSSDTEIWFLLGVCEHALGETGAGFLEESVPYRDGSEDVSLWDHAVAAFQWIRRETGVGSHGLVKSWAGDWNDYLFPMGRAGRGESMMNTGMAARAFGKFAELAGQRGQTQLQEEAAGAAEALRRSAEAVFDQTHFPRGFTDDGRPVGSPADNRCFINAQSWAALGGCGTAEQRKSALRHALKACHARRGLTLLDRPFASPPPADVSSLPIPGGEGENGGVWPQAVAWFVWALAEEGLAEDAMAVWQRSTLRRQAGEFPDTPFGIFNGPDCYNSHLAGPLEHWTQVQLWDRRVHTPMNPAVAWQAFGLWKIVCAAPS